MTRLFGLRAAADALLDRRSGSLYRTRVSDDLIVSLGPGVWYNGTNGRVITRDDWRRSSPYFAHDGNRWLCSDAGGSDRAHAR